MNETRQPSEIFPVLRWLLIPVIAAHNLEEWLTFPVYGEVGPAVAARFGIHVQAPPWDVMQVGLIIVTLVPAGIIVWAATGAAMRLKDFVSCALAGIFFANIFVPHVPAAILAGGYSPGIATALLINLPFCVALFRRAAVEQRLSTHEVFAAILCGAVALPVCLVVVFAIAEALV